MALLSEGFNNAEYLKIQLSRICERVAKYDKLYLEFGGKLFDDYHAARVLPGFDPNVKTKLLAELKDQAEMIFCINAKAIEQNKIRADIGITYDLDTMRLMDSMRKTGIYISAVLITQYSGEEAADAFRHKLELRGEKVYVHTLTKGYPSEVDIIVSPEGYGANPFIETTRPLVIVSAPGPSSGKLGTCLSQMYHEHQRGVKAGYAKYETFPVWDLPLQHPVNLAYEAATADLKDVNMIDPFHLSAYGVTAVNYNRDVEIFPVVRAILRRIIGEEPYKSPTDMGVNTLGTCITNHEIVAEAARQEVIRRWYKARCAYVTGCGDQDIVKRIEVLMSAQDLHSSNRAVVRPAVEKAEQTGSSAVALQMPNGKMITGKSSKLMNDTASVILNSIKYLAGIADEILLISPVVLEPIIRLKKEILGSRYPVLKLEEVLQALSISAATNPTADFAMKQLPALRGCEAHCSDLITQDDASTFFKLGINVTCEPQFPTKDLYFR